MSVVSIHEFGGADQSRPGEVEQPQLKADEVLSKNVVAGINYADIMLQI